MTVEGIQKPGLAVPQNPYGETLWRNLESEYMDPALPDIMKRLNLFLQKSWPEIDFLQTEMSCSGHITEDNRIKIANGSMMRWEVLPFFHVCVSRYKITNEQFLGINQFLRYLVKETCSRSNYLLYPNGMSLQPREWPNGGLAAYDEPTYLFGPSMESRVGRKNVGFEALSNFWYSFRDVLKEFDGIEDETEFKPEDFIKKQIEY
jgi:hypothetical protein